MNFVSSRPVLLGASVLYLLGMGVHSVSSAPKTATRKKADSKEHAATNNGTSPRLAQAGPRQSTKNADAASALLRYQMAVDQLLQGRTLEARVLLQDARKKFGDSPEVNLLLASLLQREGRHAEANAVAGAVKNESALAAVWDTQAGATAGVDDSPQDLIVRTMPPAGQGAATTNGTGSAAASATTVVTRASVTQSDARLAALETFLAGRVNDERKKLGLRLLTFDSTLADTARGHSLEMRDRRYFAHESPTSGLEGPLDRYRAVFQRTPAVVAENIYRSWGSPRRLSEREIEEAHTALMKSPGHHANIVLPDVTRIGVGIVTNATGDLWVTQMFARH